MIDIGSNSVRLVVYKNKNQKLKKSTNKKVTLRLGQDLKGDELSNEAINRLIRSLKKFKKKLKSIQLDSSYVVATESIRRVKNQAEIVDRVYKETGFNLVILTEAEEAYYTYIGAKACRFNEGVLINVGGASTEIIEFTEEYVTLISIPIGALNYNSAELNQVLRKIKPSMNDARLIISGGTARNIYRMLKSRQSSPYKITDLLELKEVLSSLTLLERKKYPGLSEERADIICAGMEIILKISQVFACQQFVYSKYGLREGIIFSDLGVS